MLTLQDEARTFDAALPRMLQQNEGRFAVIRGQDIGQILDTYEEALRWGYEHHGLAPFLVKQINAVETVAQFSRHIGA